MKSSDVDLIMRALCRILENQEQIMNGLVALAHKEGMEIVVIQKQDKNSKGMRRLRCPKCKESMNWNEAHICRRKKK